MASKGGVIVVVSGEDKTGEVFNAIKRHLEETEAKAKETFESLGSIGEALKGGLEMAGAAISARELVGGLKEMMQSTMEAGVEIGKLREETGISAEDLSHLKYAAASTGTTLEALTKGFKNISAVVHEAEQGNPKATKSFGDLGISVADLRGKGDDMLAVLRLVADKFRELPAGIDKNAIATELFKKSGQELIPVLNELSDALDEGESHAAIFSDEDIEKMKKMHEAVNDLEAAWQRLGITISSKAAGPLTRLMNEASSTSLSDIGKQLTEGFLGAYSPFLYTLPDAPPTPRAPGVPPAEPKKVGPASKEEIEKQNRDRMEGDRTALAEQQRQHAMSINDEIDFWQKRIGSFRRGTSQYLEVLTEINRLTKEAASKSAHEQKQVISAFVSESIDDAKDAQSENERVTEAITKTWEDDLKAQEESAEQMATAAEVRAASTARIAEAAVEHEKAAKSIGNEAAAQATASIRARQYAADIAALTELLGKLQEIQSHGGDTSAKQHEVQNQLTSLRGDAAAAALIASPIEQSNTKIEDEAEKFAHGLFDPLFNLGEKWDTQWKQIRANMMRDLGQAAESELFGMFFGDPEGRGGKGLDGSGGRKGVSGSPDGVVGDLLGLFRKGSSTVSNGIGAAGAGTTPSAEASLQQIGKGVGSTGAGIQVILNNTGTPQQVTQTQQSSINGGEQQVIQVFMKDLDTNGPMSQGIASLFLR